MGTATSNIIASSVTLAAVVAADIAVIVYQQTIIAKHARAHDTMHYVTRYKNTPLSTIDPHTPLKKWEQMQYVAPKSALHPVHPSESWFGM